MRITTKERERRRSERMAAALGMGRGAANHRLTKSLLFAMARRLGLCACFRCDQQIEAVQEFSIEHKEAWEHSPDAARLFFDHDNISFSHLLCNSRAANRNKKYKTKSEAWKASYDKRKTTPTFAAKMARRKALRHKRSAEKKLVQAQGIEPQSPQSKGGILPLDEA